jgi:thiamine kinase-like enzyme
MSEAAVFRYRGARGTLIVKRTNARESRFYSDVRPVLLERGLRAPACHFDMPVGKHSWLGLEHLPAAFPAVAFPHDASMLGALAVLHATRLDCVPRHLVHAWSDGLTYRVASQYGAHRQAMTILLERMRSTPRCENVLVWGDANPGNWAMSGDGHPVLLDWQRWGAGSRAFDLATLIPGLPGREAVGRVTDQYLAACETQGDEAPPRELLAGDILRAKAWSVLELLDEPSTPESFLASEQAAIRASFAQWLEACA